MVPGYKARNLKLLKAFFNNMNTGIRRWWMIRQVIIWKVTDQYLNWAICYGYWSVLGILSVITLSGGTCGAVKTQSGSDSGCSMAGILLHHHNTHWKYRKHITANVRAEHVFRNSWFIHQSLLGQLLATEHNIASPLFPYYSANPSSQSNLRRFKNRCLWDR